MYDNELVLEIMNQIYQAAQTILQRFEPVISHHYFQMDADVIFDVCKEHIPHLAQTVNKMIKDLSKN